MRTQRKSRRSNRISVQIVFRILFSIGFLSGCSFVRVSQVPLKPISNFIWFSGPFETDTAFLPVFSGFLFDLLLYALPIFLFGMTFLGAAIVPIVLFAKGFTLGAALIALVQSEGTGMYFRRCLDYLLISVLGISVLLYFAEKAFITARYSSRMIFKNKSPLSEQVSIKTYTVQFLFAFALLAVLSLLYCALHFLIVQI